MLLSPFFLLLASVLSSPSPSSSPLRPPHWPNPNDWQAFNTSLSGRLLASYPPAAVCHNPLFDSAACKTAQTEWRNSFWRTNQTGAYSAIAWELGGDQCFIDSPRDAPCEQGLVPRYSVAAEKVEDVQKAVRFAQRFGVRLVVKNTGHDHLGRSSGASSLGIWTHRLKSQTYHSSFIPTRAPKSIVPVQAVTLGAGEQWLDVYRGAAERGRVVVGGHARTVGAVGGYLTGGGHGPFANRWGLAVDNLIEATLVDATGSLRTINAHTAPDHFFALRGGAGCSWGILISATYATHPLPRGMRVALAQFNASSPESFAAIIRTALPALVPITDAGWTGYATMTDRTAGFIFSRPDGTEAEFNASFAALAKIADLKEVKGQLGSYEAGGWPGYFQTWLSDPNIATNVLDTSRLLTAEVLKSQAGKLAELVLEMEREGFAAGFNFIGKVNPAVRDQTSVHPIWAESRGVFSLGIDWADDAPADEIRRKRLHSIEVSRRLGEIVRLGKGDGKSMEGTYVNEANPYQPDWQNVFWGKNYGRLLKIKRQIDPRNLFACNRCIGTDILFEP